MVPSIGELCELQGRMTEQEWRVCSDVAQVVASYLDVHPRVSAVRYPGLRADPLYATASCTLERGFGPIVAWRDAATGAWHLFDASADEESLDSHAAVLRLEGELRG